MSQNQTEYFRQYREKNRDRLKAQQREYYLANKEQINARNKAYYHENKEAVKQAQRKYVERTRRKTSEYQKSWREQNVLYIKQYHKRYYLENREEIIEKSIRYQQSCPKAKAAKALRRRLYSVIRTKGLYSGTKDLLGCSFEDFRDYIEAQFKGCMNWDNYGPPRTTLISAANGLCGVWLRFESSTDYIQYYSLPKPCHPSANSRSRYETSYSRRPLANLCCLRRNLSIMAA